MLICILGVFALDTLRPVENQKTAVISIAAISAYQTHVSKHLPFVRCRYKESCSAFCKRSLKERGFWAGLYKSLCRLNSCI
jgi:putative component of membrane protein insertase Oxa1/YidC/SpoIIIJ protein YidD